MAEDSDNFWAQAWTEGQTPWHRENADAELFASYQSLCERFEISSASRVLVPLCGASRAVGFFYEKGHTVCGVDLIPDALMQLRVDLAQHGVLGSPEAEVDRLELVAADFFEFVPAAPFDLIYDRAALIAIDPDLRPAYANEIRACLRKGGLLLLSSRNFVSEDWLGPPFPIDPAEIERLFPEFMLRDMKLSTVTTEEQRFLDAGVREIENRFSVLQY